MHVVTFDEPQLAAALARPIFRDHGLALRVAHTEVALVAATAEDRPDLVILVPGRFDPRRERSLARELRAQLAPHGQLLIAVPAAMSLALELSIYDGLIALDDPEADLVAAVASIAAAAEQREARRSVRLPVELVPATGRHLEGSTMDLSRGGAGVLLWRAPESVGRHGLRLFRRDGRSVTVDAEIAWIDRLTPAVRVGLRFPSASPAQLHAIQELALWEVVAEAGELVMHLHGELTGASPLGRVLANLTRVRALDLSGITGVDPAGAKALVELLRALPSGVRIRRAALPVARLLVCMPAAIACAGTDADDDGRCRVESLIAPFHCSRCGRASAALIGWRARAMPLPCPACGRAVLPWRPCHTPRGWRQATS